MEKVREFHYSDGELTQKSDYFVNIGNRDKVVLTGYGMPETYLDDTQTLRDEFAYLPMDQEMQAPVQEATERKTNARNDVEKAMKDIVNRAELCFGKNSPSMKRFKTGSINDLNDPDLYRTAGRVTRAATKLLDKLSTNGVTQEMITDTENKNKVFDDIIDEHQDLENERLEATAIRVDTANKLFKRIVKISEYGKAAFKGKDDVKAAEYLLGD